MGLTKTLAHALTDYKAASSLGSKLRTSRMQHLLPLIETVYAKNGSVAIIDIGGTKTFWNILPKEKLDSYNIKITVVNLAGSNCSADDNHFTFVDGDGCNLSGFDNNSFDIAHSNSVIEHVGDWKQMRKFAQEILRLAPITYIQTPFFWFPIEPHFMTPFFHWLPRPVRIALCLTFGLGHFNRALNIDEAVAKVDCIELLDYRLFQELFPKLSIKKEKVLFLTKSLIGISSGA
ncbi:MAG: class I SAM-dependent methyltransferase [Candidatus Margulisiibacteriota bacterium]|nr:MAG: hypothetical protein A2X43_08815 [Candidatus Margulisbacteria bacterium GWD2_39_127]OGI02086.1 MAG: hypothetical protein A2X42_01290 [Candidatus Margulisbacteria bacterium GWF2_38_17]OGI10463.1 MAG: hypothetical protein A2X41_06790 [Candidatus Margulisbacteria bacterium GWE2_39_32]PZM79991.1 MAG: class I SAM-dependent methyltransferase [Candidatus Margulisiibacteriota bacterium]HAR63016.1 hypothetical protein [Candidatus Margulisiibacteriota bacterium]